MCFESRACLLDAFELDPALNCAEFARAGGVGWVHMSREPFLLDEDGAYVRAVVIAIAGDVCERGRLDGPWCIVRSVVRGDF
jgi:hypothetical protein